MNRIDLRFCKNQTVRKMKKRAYQLQVEFAAQAGMLVTLEGRVAYQPGDAIVTGLRGEQWPVPRDDFDKKYQPVVPTQMVQPGSYQTLPSEVLAIQLEQEINLPLSDERGSLHGRAGDWLLQYESGGQAVIAPAIFDASYEAADNMLPFIVGIAGHFDQTLTGLCQKIQTLAGLTPVLFLQSDGQSDCRLWKFSAGELTPTTLHRHQFNDQLFRATAASYPEQLAACLLKNSSLLVTGQQLAEPFSTAIQSYSEYLPYWAKRDHDSSQESAVQDLFSLPQVATVLDRSQLEHWLSSHDLSLHSKRAANKRLSRWQQFRKMLPDLGSIWRGVNLAATHENHQAEQFSSLSEQVSELRLFNEEISRLPQPGQHQPVDPNHSLHLHADQLAGANQDCWQALVFATTKRIAGTGGLIYALRNARFASYFREMAQRFYSLFGLGLLAAMSFAAFTEIGGGCDAEDWFAFSGCSSGLWKHWGGAFFLASYLVVLLIALLRYGNAKQAEYERKHQDYRLLAEALRVQYCWNRAGCRIAVADALPASDQDDNRWVRKALRAFHFMQLGSYTEAEQLRLNWFADEFIRTQQAYHQDTLLTRREKAIHFMAARAKIGLILFQIFVVLISANTGLELAGREALEGMAHHLLILGMLASLGWWAANKKVIDTFGLESEVRRGKSVLEALEKSLKLIDQFRLADQPKTMERQIDELIFEIGRIFVSDQASWHTLHRERPVEAATGA